MREPDPWQWTAVLQSGSKVAEVGVGTLKAIPAHAIRSLHLRHPGGGHVAVDYLTGEAEINGGRLQSPAIGRLGFLPPFIPIFFRRWVALNGSQPRPQFRAIGMAAYSAQDPQFALLRVYDGRVDANWVSAWPPETVHHSASQALLVGGTDG